MFGISSGIIKRCYALFSLFFFFSLPFLSGCSSLFLYHPLQKEFRATPASSGLQHETVILNTADGIKIYGWWIPAEHERGVILFCHGNGGNISHNIDNLVIFYKLNMSVFIFDYRGFGFSEGRTTESGTYLDSEAAWNYLVKTRSISPDRIVIFGRSLGGAVAARLASRHSGCALIIESSFTSIQDLVKDYVQWLPEIFLPELQFETMQSLQKCPSSILIIHSPEDETVPFKHGLKLYETATGPKQFLQIRGPHNSGFLDSLPIYEKGLNDFLSSSLMYK